MKLKEIIERFETIAPLSLAEPWDKVGVHVGSGRDEVRKAMLCIDLTPDVVDQAVKAGAQLIFAYHPPIFEPLKTLSPVSWKHEALLSCIKKNIAVFSPHTAVDAAAGGVNDWLAAGLGDWENMRTIRPRAQEQMGKLVVFVPAKHVDGLRDALDQAGAGRLGNYSRCTFNVTGQGTFQGNEASSPAVGKAGQFERVEEVRMEMIFPWKLRQHIAQVARGQHPYEEPAMDMYLLDPAVLPLDEYTGQGRIVELDTPVTLNTLADRIRKHLGVKHVTTCPAAGQSRKIRTVGLCAGAGGSLLPDAGAVDAFFTGEMRYHDVLDANQRGVGILLAGHVETERPFLKVLQKRLVKMTGKQVTWTVARA